MAKQDQSLAMGVQNDDYKTLEITLTGTNNKTLKGVLNFTATDLGDYRDEDGVYDSKGAATFVVVVILVYGLSIVLMIGSLAKKNMKVKDVDAEEKQIHRYLSQANDLRDQGAKENYRQLKRNIISLVNKSPEGTNHSLESPKTDANMGNFALRSLLAVGSPSAAAEVMVKKDTPSSGDSDSEQSPHKANRLVSETDSLQALLEEDEDGEDEAFATPPPVIRGPPRVEVRPALGRHSIVSQHGAEPPRTTLASPLSVTSINRDLRSDMNVLPATHTSQSPSNIRTIPTVVISDPEGGVRNNRLRPLDISKTRDSNRLNSLEQESKIICDVGGNEPGKPCKLSMDSDGNIWIRQASPDANSALGKPPPSPSISTPGSIGYESLGTSRTPSPCVNDARTPSPAVPFAGGSTRTRTERSHSPAHVVTGQKRRDRSRSPRDIARSHAPRDTYDGPRSPTSRSPPEGPAHSGSCCEHNHGTTITSVANILPSGRKSPYRETRDHTIRDAYRNDTITQRNDTYLPTRSPVLHSKLSNSNMQYPTTPDTDDEELVQITTV